MLAGNVIETKSTKKEIKVESGEFIKAYVDGKQIGKSAKVGTSGTYKITIPKQN